MNAIRCWQAAVLTLPWQVESAVPLVVVLALPRQLVVLGPVVLLLVLISAPVPRSVPGAEPEVRGPLLVGLQQQELVGGLAVVLVLRSRRRTGLEVFFSVFAAGIDFCREWRLVMGTRSSPRCMLVVVWVAFVKALLLPLAVRWC